MKFDKKLVAAIVAAILGAIAMAVNHWAEAPDAPEVMDRAWDASTSTSTHAAVLRKLQSNAMYGRFGGIGLLPLMAVGSNGPLNEERPQAYQGSLGQAETVTTAIDAANTECLVSTGGGSACGLYAFDSVTPITTIGHGTVCMSQRRLGVTLGTQAAETEGVLTVDGTADGACEGYTFVAAAGTVAMTHDFIPRAESMRLHGPQTYTGRYCDLTTRGMGGEQVHPPCGLGYQTQILTLPADPTDSVTYPITINGVVVTTAALDGSSTTAELQAAMVTAVNASAVASVVTAANSTTHVIITSDTGGVAFTVALGTQPAAPIVLGAAVTVAAADTAECVAVAGAGGTCIASGDSRNGQYENEHSGAVYYFGRPAVNATRYSAATER